MPLSSTSTAAPWALSPWRTSWKSWWARSGTSTTSRRSLSSSWTPHTYLIDGDWTFDDFCSYFHIADDADSVSLGGWIMERMEKVPAAGESFEYGGLSITVEEISNNRIQKVRVVQLEQPQEEDSEK